jgi:hypothetical protein
MREEPATIHPLLFECITHDPRWDSQIEDRSDFYARLCIATEMSLAALTEYLRITPDGREGETALAVSTLGRMAELGSGDAINVLREYVTYGPLWDHALGLLASMSDKGVVEGLAEAVCARFETGKQMDDSSYYDIYSSYSSLMPLWKVWSETQPCIAKLMNEVDEIRSGYRKHIGTDPDYKALSVEELLDAARPHNRRHIEKVLLSRLRHSDVKLYVQAFDAENVFAWRIAFNCLEAMKRAKSYYERILNRIVGYLEAAKDEAVRGPKISACDAILRQLPPEMTLQVARRWYSSGEWRLQLAGEEVLERHATPEDIDRALATLEAARNDAVPYYSDLYRACGALEILARMSNVGPLPEVEAAFVEMGYSFGRKRAAQAMRANAPEWFAETYAYECLWDCEEETRQLGCEGVSLAVTGARERLRYLAGDPFEVDMVREAAASRLVTA